MPDYRFSRPIPGQSLTSEPRNAKWQRPPEMNDPEEALMMHIDRLNDPERITSLAQMIDMGFNVRSLTEGILRSAVAEGIHSIDVSLMIAPVVHEFIRSNLDILGIEYENGFGTKEERSKNHATMAEANEISRLTNKNREVMKEKEPTAPVHPTPVEDPADPELALIERRPQQ